MYLFLLLTVYGCVLDANANAPNIIFILADDLGYSDTGITNPLAITPNLNELANEGVFLNQSYVQSVCTPSRAALLSGIYPFRTGMQNGPIQSAQPKCLNTSLILLPGKLQELGYSTHAVGKWHVGFCDVSCTPTARGFDSFMGLYNAYSDHYTRVVSAGTLVSGVDHNVNNVGSNDTWGQHSTPLFTNYTVDLINEHDDTAPLFIYLAYQAPHFPLQVPSEWSAMYDSISDLDRRSELAMTSQMDDGIGQIVAALKENNMVDNTLLVFMSDNGGSPQSGGYNYPLRGRKNSTWEGGVRSQTLLWGGVLQKTNYVNDGLMHAVDWFPTLVNIAGGSTDDLEMELDGIDNTAMLLEGAKSERADMMYHINEMSEPYEAAVRNEQYKLLLGNPGDGGWFIPPEHNVSDTFIKSTSSDLTCDYDYSFPAEWTRYMFDIQADPNETNNVLCDFPEIAEELERRIAEYEKKRIPAINPPSTPDLADPENFGGFWSTGWC